MRQGPHHGAQKSTRTGSWLFNTSWSHSASFTSAGFAIVPPSRLAGRIDPRPVIMIVYPRGVCQMPEQPATKQTDVETEAILTRLRRIEGQIRGIHRMLEEDRVCEDVVTQLMAARSSLDQAGLLIIDHHIDRCLVADRPSEAALRNLRQPLRMWFRFGCRSQENGYQGPCAQNPPVQSH